MRIHADHQPYRKKPFVARWYEGKRQRNEIFATVTARNDFMAQFKQTDPAFPSIEPHKLICRAAEGTEETLFSIPLNPTGLYNFERTVNFHDSGTFTLIARAQDSTGRITDSEIAIEIDQPSGKVATSSISQKRQLQPNQP